MSAVVFFIDQVFKSKYLIGMSIELPVEKITSDFNSVPAVLMGADSPASVRLSISSPVLLEWSSEHR